MDLKAKITLAGVDYVYAIAGGKNWGNYTGPGFVHQNIQAVHPTPDIPGFEVYFRPDTDGSRVEVVFELGKLWGAANAAAAHLGPYQATIMDGSTVLAQINAPSHWWFSRWRYQSTPRPIIRSPSQGIAAHLLPPFGTQNVPGNFEPLDLTPYVYSKPMDLANITAYMPQTGGRPDIGLHHEVFAYWMAHPDDPAAEAAARAVAEAHGTIPEHYRDETTGAPVSLITHPLFNVAWAHNDFQVVGNQLLLNSGGFATSGITLDAAHHPELSYVMFACTGDRYFFENLAGATTQAYAGTIWWSTQTTAYLPREETRGYAWGLRTNFCARKAAELAESWGALPPDMLGQSYYKTLLDNQLAQHIALFINNPTPAGTIWTVGPEINAVAFWQDEFLGNAVQEAIWFKFDEWRPVGDWKLDGTIFRVTSCPAYCCQYESCLCAGHFAMQVKGPDQPGAPTASEYMTTYMAELQFMSENDIGSHGGQWQPGELAALQADPTNGGRRTFSQNPDYLNNCLTHLSFGEANAFAKAIAPRAMLAPYMNGEVQTYRAAIMPSIDGVIPLPPVNNPPPVVVPPDPPPVIIPPPTGTGVPPMATTQFDPGSVGTITLSNPKDTNGNADPFVTGDILSFQILNASDSSVAADQGSFGPTTFSADNLSATVPFTRPQAVGVYLLRPTLTNADGTPAVGTDTPFGVGVPVKDITSFDTAIS